MRIALSGAHAVGKSTLLADLDLFLAAYKVVDEPYYELLDEGAVFADSPSADDYLTQLERSIARLISDREPNILYDRCPADFLAYLSALGAHTIVREWLLPAANALSTLDLIVFVPIEQPDRIAGVGGAGRLRRRVDVLLREILLEDSHGFARPVISVHGSENARVQRLVAALQQRGVQTRSRAG